MNADEVRICVIRHGYFPQDPRVRKEVCALLEEGYKVDVICLRDKGEQPFEVWHGAKVYRLPVRHQRRGLLHYIFEYLNFFIRALLKVSVLHLKQRYNLVQVNNIPNFLVFAALLPRLLGAKVILDMHELMPEFFASRFKFAGSSLLVRLVKVEEKLSVWFAHQIIVVNPLLASILKQRGINKPYVIVPNAPDEAIFFESVQQHNDNVSQPVLLTHGTIVERYGTQVLIRALPYILKEYSVKVYIVGDGEFLEDLKKEVIEKGLQQNVVFTGRVPIEEVRNYISQASIGVVPILKDGYAELMSPNKLFEYVALKKPVLAADTPGIRAYFDERHLIFFRPGDPEDLARKAIALLKDPQRRDQLASQAWEVYETIRWARTKIVYKEFIRNLLTSGQAY